MEKSYAPSEKSKDLPKDSFNCEMLKKATKHQFD
jgi:hypothetical protein